MTRWVRPFMAFLLCTALFAGSGATVMILAQDASPEAETPIETPIETDVPVETVAPIETDVPVETVAPIETDVPVETTETVDPTESTVDAAEDVITAAKAPINPVSGAVNTVTVSPTTLATACDSVSVHIDWAVPDDAGAGSTFSVTLDSRLNVANQTLFLPSPDPGVNIARLQIVDGVATFTLLSYVETHNNNLGFAEFGSSSCWAEEYAGTTVPLNFTGDIAGGPITQPVEVPALPTPTVTNTPAPTNTPANTPTATPTIDPSIPTSTATGTAPPTPTRTPTRTPTVTPTWDPSIPTNTPTPTRTPRPTRTPSPTPIPVRDAQKHGEFLTFDQGKTDGTKALGWTIDGIQGPFASLTITDAVPAGANWQFNCDAGSVTYTPSAGTTFTCSPSQVTVTFTNLGAGVEASATFLADTKAPFEGLQTFGNDSTWAGDGLSGASNTGYLVQTQSGGGGGGGNTPTPLPTNSPTATPTETPALTIVTPIDPTSTDGSCLGGKWTAPTVSPTTTEGVTYAVSEIDPESGAYTVTATLEDGHGWGTMPGGWTLEQDGSAIYAGTVELNPCNEVTPVAPVVTQGVCTGGEIVPPSVTPVTTVGIVYSIDGTVTPGTTVTVIATLEDGSGFGELPSGWTQNDDGTASLAVVLDDVECTPVIPVTPIVTGNTCLDGVYTPPTVSVNDTESGLSYEISPVDAETGAYTVTATLTDGQEWGDLSAGWTETDASTATYSGVVELAPCTPVAPVNPAITEAVCTGGILVAPSVIPAETDGIVYTTEGGVAPGSTVLVKATLEDGYSWAGLPEGWTKFHDATATFTVVLDDVECEQVLPAAPIVTDAVCVGGALTDPDVLLQETTGMTYTLTGEVVNGGSVLVTATLEDGFSWAELPDGWTKVDDATATYAIELAEVDCTPVQPVTPMIIDPYCTGGTLIDPSVTPIPTVGVTYALVGEMVNGGTVVVTATVDDGFAWAELPDGWVKIDDATATFTTQFPDVECTKAVPATPAVTQATCTTGGVVLPPSIAVDPTTGIVYTRTGEAVSGGTVVVIAKLVDGYAWGTLPKGWTKVDEATATFTVNLASVECDQPTPDPAKPTKTPAPHTPDPAKPTKTPDPHTPDASKTPQVTVVGLPSTGQGDADGLGGGALLAALAVMSAILAGVAFSLTRRTRRTDR